MAREIAGILAAHPKTSARMAEALVRNFEESASFAQAKANVGTLQMVQTWTPRLLNRIEAAVKDNDQVSRAFGVPEQVRSLLRLHGGGDATPPEEWLPF